MLPLYIPSTQTEITDYSQRYIHPLTNIVYGKTDYDDVNKLAEIGAYNYTQESIPYGKYCNEWIFVEESGVYIKRPKELFDVTTIDTSPSADDIKRMVLENTYLDATKNLILLSGGTVPDNTWPKLEDTDFSNISLLAANNNPALATVLLATLNYTFFQLKMMGWAWENIERRDLS